MNWLCNWDVSGEIAMRISIRGTIQSPVSAFFIGCLLLLSSRKYIQNSTLFSFYVCNNDMDCLENHLIILLIGIYLRDAVSLYQIGNNMKYTRVYSESNANPTIP